MARDPRIWGGTLAHLAQSARATLPPIHPAGRGFIALGLSVALLGHHHRVLRRLGFGFAAATAFSFRHPARVPPSDRRAIVSPADGTVCLVDQATPPADLGLSDFPRPRVAIFLSILDVHIQRAPITGTVTKIAHTPGRFLPADDPAAGQANERNALRLRDNDGVVVDVVQIAGLLARRIVCQAKVSQRLERGAPYGLIRFGSRVDTYLPVGTTPLVRTGQRMVAGETVLGTLP